MGIGLDYQDEVSDSKHDTVWWEFGKFMKLLLSSNPTVLEALFIPDQFVLYEHPIITSLKKNRERFLTKASFMPFGGYAVSQIKKAQGQNKKVHWDAEDMKRKTPMDFCFTLDDKQGSKPMQEWLDERGLRQDCCGLVNIPNMPGMYGVYYDFGQHFRMENIKEIRDIPSKLFEYVCLNHIETANDVEKWFKDNYTPIGGYCGIVKTTFEDETDRTKKDESKSNAIRFSETPKGSKPICVMSYNDNGYQTHCKKYREYVEWKAKRNKARYDNNMEGIRTGDIEYIYDAKNMMHCFRLVKMCIEVANGYGLNVDRRPIDAEFLLDIRNRKFKYSELITELNKLKVNMDIACEQSHLPKAIDPKVIDEETIRLRQEFWDCMKTKDAVRE